MSFNHSAEKNHVKRHVIRMKIDWIRLTSISKSVEHTHL